MRKAAEAGDHLAVSQRVVEGAVEGVSLHLARQGRE